MKKSSILFSLTFFFIISSATVFAQDVEVQAVSKATPKWISALGYWIVEGNIHTPKHNIVYFYNNNHVRVYKETLDGIVINLKKRKTKMRLKKLVDQTVTAYVQKQKGSENEMLVKNLIK